MDQKRQLEMVSEEPSYLGEHELTHSMADAQAEGRTMLSAGGIIFGFLLNVALQSSGGSDRPEAFLIQIAALLCSAVSLMLFAMPTIYHHLEFPYKNQEKFILRSHYFLSLGILFFGVTVFLGITLAFYSRLGAQSWLLAIATFVFLALLYRMRSKEFLVRNPPSNPAE